jgi:hypothetical protein
MGAIRLLIAALAGTVALAATLPVLLLGAPLWTVAGLTRLFRAAARAMQPGEVAWTELTEFTPDIGWKNRPNARVRVREGRTFLVSTDEDGWRGDGTIAEADMVVFGDSFAFGHGVSDGDFFPHRMRGVRAKAVGVNGYSMVQELLWMQRVRDHLAGKLVVWFVFYGNDLFDNLHPSFRHYRAPFVRSTDGGSGWEIVTDHVRPEPWPFDPKWGYRNKIAEACTPSYHSERAYSACAFLIDQALDVFAETRTELAVVGIPDVQMLDRSAHTELRRRSTNLEAFDPGLPDRRLREICGNRGLPVVTLSDVLSVHHHLPDDCHWTPAGHARVAKVLEELYRARPRSSTERVQGTVLGRIGLSPAARPDLGVAARS